MSKNILFPILMLLSFTAYAKTQYIPAELDQFRKTGVCVGCDLSQANLSSEPHNNSNLSDSLLVKANLEWGSFNVSNFNNAKIVYANLEYIHSSGSSFISADLSGSNLGEGNFSSCDFTNAILNDVNFQDAILVRAKISEDQLKSARSLSCAIMPDGSRHDSDNGHPCLS